MTVRIFKRVAVPFILGTLTLPRLIASVQLTEATSSFPLVVKGRAASIAIPANSAEVVRIAASDLAADIETVTGVRPAILNQRPDGPRIEAYIDPALAGHWEAFRLTSTADVLTITASDRRGLAYGLYEISRRIGVSPWAWWADVPVEKRAELRLTLETEPLDQPAVKYRGIFINDEGWGLVPWASKTFEPEVGNLGPKTYAKIFELLLRLRANALWPAMHPGTRPFHTVPGNADAADRYAIVVGSSHAEPMLRNNVGEWTQDKKLYNYSTNPDGVLAYWEQRVKERTSGESLFTLGMRGIHDSAIVGYRNQRDRIAAVEEIIAKQRALLARYLGDGDPAKVGQIFVPYKEVLSDYNAGLKIPDDIALVWPDDNFGYIRRYGTPDEQKRSGGLGVYYHASYLGSPLPWLWIDSLPPALVWSEMTRAYEQGANGVWIVNVGDIKNTELSMEFFLDLAWHADRTSPDAPRRFLRDTATRDFGADNADAIAGIQNRHRLLAAARKPEHLGWNLPKRPYEPTDFTDTEIHERLAAYADLARDTDTVAARLPADARDAFFELVAYPVKSADAANRRYFNAEQARRLKVRGDDSAALATFALSEVADREIDALTRIYNENIAGGKWRHIVMVNGLSPRDWFSFQVPAILPLDDADALAAVTVQEQTRVSPPEAKASRDARSPVARAGDFVERDGVISINAGHFTGRSDLPSGAGWRAVDGLGRTGSAVTVLPSTADITTRQAPSLDYRFHVATGGPATLRVRLLPTFPLNPKNGLRLAVAIDDGTPIPVTITDGFEPKSSAWNERVLRSATETSVTLPAPLSPGEHTLRLIAVDTGVVVDKIVIDLGGLTPSYNGPAETRVP